MAKKAFKAADLFCGAGGTSTGLAHAATILNRKVELVAVNHWDRAVETHAANHPSAAHHCEDLTSMDPRKAVPGGKLDLLVASPECTHHSVARGGKPINDQSRASAWCVLRWATALTVDRIIIENVPEFVTWGPIGANDRPLASRKGETFTAFITALKSLGYRVEWKTLNAADHGGATTRRRLFVQAARGRRAIRWPAPSHEAKPQSNLLGSLPRWRAAREIIDWTLPGTSIFGRKRPLSENTLKRIEAGLRKFGGGNAEPFLVVLRQHMDAKSIDGPVPTLTAGANHIGLCEPFLLHTTHHGSDRVYSQDEPLPCVTGANRGEQALVEPFVVSACHGGDHERRAKSLDNPLGTVTTSKEFGLVEPFILPHRQFDGMQVDSIDQPLRTVTAKNGNDNALVEPFLVSFYGNSTEAHRTAEPLRTVTTKDRHGLVQPSSDVRLDIRFRMLQPHELKQAMGFPKDYVITGNRSEQVKQIGNAVEVNQAAALCREAIMEAAA